MKTTFVHALTVASCISSTTAASAADILLASCQPSSATVIQLSSHKGFGIGGGHRFIKLNHLDGMARTGIVCTPNLSTLSSNQCAIFMEVVEPLEVSTGSNYITVEVCTTSGLLKVDCTKSGRGGELLTYEITSPVKINSFSVYLTKTCSAEIGGIAVTPLPVNQTRSQTLQPASATLDFSALPPEIDSGWMFVGPGSSSLLAAAAAWDALAAALQAEAALLSSASPSLQPAISSNSGANTARKILKLEQEIRQAKANAAVDRQAAMTVSLKSIDTTPISCGQLHLPCN